MLKLSRLALAAAIMFAAPIQLSAQGDAAPGTTGLNPGDQVRIAVWRNPEFSGDFIIAPNGTISHPLYREIQVVGVPLSTVEERLRAFLTRYIQTPQFVIQPLVKIIVGGEVRSPNVYSVPPETTIAQAVALAGGPTDRGNLRKLQIIRDGQEIPVDLSKADSDVARLQIRSGDQILIPRRGSTFRDYAGPIFSGLAALAAVVNIIISTNNSTSN
jgi:polysaccharide export outer membrane protein